MKSKIIAIIGTGGVGKTYLTYKLAKALNGISIVEDTKDISKKLRTGKNKFHIFSYIRKEHIKRINEAKSLKKKRKIIIVDKWIILNKFYIKILSSGILKYFLLTRHFFDEFIAPKPEIIIFLDANNKKIKELIKKRNRDFDTNKFLELNFKIKKDLKKYFKRIGSKKKWIYVDRTNLDFDKKKDLELIFKIIKNNLK
jgi:deoxyadenosine/deoxycytidine kinase